jgi:hypothetical protein
MNFRPPDMLSAQQQEVPFAAPHSFHSQDATPHTLLVAPSLHPSSAEHEYGSQSSSLPLSPHVYPDRHLPHAHFAPIQSLPHPDDVNRSRDEEGDYDMDCDDDVPGLEATVTYSHVRQDHQPDHQQLEQQHDQQLHQHQQHQQIQQQQQQHQHQHQQQQQHLPIHAVGPGDESVLQPPKRQRRVSRFDNPHPHHRPHPQPHQGLIVESQVAPDQQPPLLSGDHWVDGGHLLSEGASQPFGQHSAEGPNQNQGPYRGPYQGPNHGQGHGQSEDQGQILSQGQGPNHGQGPNTGPGQGQGPNHGQGPNMGQGQVQGPNHGQGQGPNLGQGPNMGQGQGHFQDQVVAEQWIDRPEEDQGPRYSHYNQQQLVQLQLMQDQEREQERQQQIHLQQQHQMLLQQQLLMEQQQQQQLLLQQQQQQQQQQRLRQQQQQLAEAPKMSRTLMRKMRIAATSLLGEDTAPALPLAPPLPLRTAPAMSTSYPPANFNHPHPIHAASFSTAPVPREVVRNMNLDRDTAGRDRDRDGDRGRDRDRDCGRERSTDRPALTADSVSAGLLGAKLGLRAPVLSKHSLLPPVSPRPAAPPAQHPRDKRERETKLEFNMQGGIYEWSGVERGREGEKSGVAREKGREVSNAEREEGEEEEGAATTSRSRDRSRGFSVDRRSLAAPYAPSISSSMGRTSPLQGPSLALPVPVPVPFEGPGLYSSASIRDVSPRRDRSVFEPSAVDLGLGDGQWNRHPVGAENPDPNHNPNPNRWGPGPETQGQGDRFPGSEVSSNATGKPMWMPAAVTVAVGASASVSTGRATAKVAEEMEEGEEEEDEVIVVPVKKRETGGTGRYVEHNGNNGNNNGSSNINRTHRSHEPHDQRSSHGPHSRVANEAGRSLRSNSGSNQDAAFTVERERERMRSFSDSTHGNDHGHGHRNGLVEYEQSNSGDGDRDIERERERERSPTLRRLESGREGWAGSDCGVQGMSDVGGPMAAPVPLPVPGGYDVLGKGAVPCRYFNGRKGCQFGDACQFGHFAAASSSLSGPASIPDPYLATSHLGSGSGLGLGLGVNAIAEGLGPGPGPGQYLPGPGIAMRMGQGPGPVGYVGPPSSSLDQVAGPGHGLGQSQGQGHGQGPHHLQQQQQQQQQHVRHSQNLFFAEEMPVRFLEQQQQQQQAPYRGEVPGQEQGQGVYPNPPHIPYPNRGPFEDSFQAGNQFVDVNTRLLPPGHFNPPADRGPGPGLGPGLMHAMPPHHHQGPGPHPGPNHFPSIAPDMSDRGPAPVPVRGMAQSQSQSQRVEYMQGQGQGQGPGQGHRRYDEEVRGDLAKFDPQFEAVHHPHHIPPHAQSQHLSFQQQHLQHQEHLQQQHQQHQQQQQQQQEQRHQNQLQQQQELRQGFFFESGPHVEFVPPSFPPPLHFQAEHRTQEKIDMNPNRQIQMQMQNDWRMSRHEQGQGQGQGQGHGPSQGQGQGGWGQGLGPNSAFQPQEEYPPGFGPLFPGGGQGQGHFDPSYQKY